MSAAGRPIYKTPWFIAAAVGVLALTGLRMCMTKELQELPVLGHAPAFELTSQTGEPFSSAALQGKVWIASFIFTTCVTVCPQVTAANADLQDKLAAKGLDQVRLVSFTVDPELDTPVRLADYGRKHGADPARWVFLTGTAETLFGVVTAGFQLAMGNKTEEGGVADISHSTKLVLVDKAGRIRHYFGSDANNRGLLVAHAAALQAEEVSP